MPHDDEIFLFTLPMERLDAAAAPEFKGQIQRDLAPARRLVIVDFSKVTFVDSTGLGVIVFLLKTMPSEGRLAITSLQPAVRRLFEITKLDRVFEIFDDVEEARVALNS